MGCSSPPPSELKNDNHLASLLGEMMSQEVKQVSLPPGLVSEQIIL
jgi:hypothetical protein